jgi:hypothetical protein
MIRLWTGQLVLRIARARTRTSTTIPIASFLIRHPFSLSSTRTSICPKYFVEIEEKKGRNEDRLFQHRINERYMHNQCKSISSRSICFQDSPNLHETRTHTHMYVYTKILVLQYFLIAYLQMARTERSICSPERNNREEGRKLYDSFTIRLLDVLSLCSGLIKTHTLSREKA